MKHAFHVILLLLALSFWKGFLDSGKNLEALNERLEEVEQMGDPKDEADSIEGEITSAQSWRMILGLLLTIGTASVAGIFVWAYLLPYLAQRATHVVYDSGEMLEKDSMREAHSLIAQGEFEAAVKAYRKVVDEDPGNRLPWWEMSKVLRTNLDDSNGAIEVLRDAIEAHAWDEEDAAFLLFRLVDIYDEDLQDRATGRALMQQVIDTFPDSRHSANAAHKIQEWDREEEEKAFMEQRDRIDSDGNSVG